MLYFEQSKPPAGDTLPMVTPNVAADESQNLLYKYWKVRDWALHLLTIENKFDEQIIVTNLDGFTEACSVNDLLPWQTTAGGLIDINLYKAFRIRGMKDKFSIGWLYLFLQIVPLPMTHLKLKLASRFKLRCKIRFFWTYT